MNNLLNLLILYDIVHDSIHENLPERVGLSLYKIIMDLLKEKVTQL